MPSPQYVKHGMGRPFGSSPPSAYSLENDTLQKGCLLHWRQPGRRTTRENEEGQAADAADGVLGWLKVVNVTGGGGTAILVAAVGENELVRVAFLHKADIHKVLCQYLLFLLNDAFVLGPVSKWLLRVSWQKWHPWVMSTLKT